MYSRPTVLSDRQTKQIQSIPKEEEQQQWMPKMAFYGDGRPHECFFYNQTTST
jgi:hypothetical protein